MLFEIRCFLYFVFCVTSVLIKDSQTFEEEYFDGEFPRSTTDCDNPLLKLKCTIKCREHQAVCYKASCYCFIKYELKNVRRPKILHRPSTYNLGGQELTQAEKEVGDLYLTRPALRHHITHFCPDLDTARACIIECMKYGKPSFCGKDHNCYCGHRFVGQGDNEYIDVAGVYAEFLDMYEKYFGPKPDNVKIEDIVHMGP